MEMSCDSTQATLLTSPPGPTPLMAPSPPPRGLTLPSLTVCHACSPRSAERRVAEPSLSERLAVFLLLAQTLAKAAKIPEATKVRCTMCCVNCNTTTPAYTCYHWHCSRAQDLYKQLIVVKVSQCMWEGTHKYPPCVYCQGKSVVEGLLFLMLPPPPPPPPPLYWFRPKGSSG